MEIIFVTIEMAIIVIIVIALICDIAKTEEEYKKSLERDNPYQKALERKRSIESKGKK